MIGRQTGHYQPWTVLSSWESEIPSLSTMDLGQAGVNISHHLPVSMQSLVVELSC